MEWKYRLIETILQDTDDTIAGWSTSSAGIEDMKSRYQENQVRMEKYGNRIGMWIPRRTYGIEKINRM